MLTLGHLRHAQTSTCKHTHPDLGWLGHLLLSHTHTHTPLLPSGGQCVPSRRGIITWVAIVVAISFKKVSARQKTSNSGQQPQIAEATGPLGLFPVQTCLVVCKNDLLLICD